MKKLIAILSVIILVYGIYWIVSLIISENRIKTYQEQTNSESLENKPEIETELTKYIEEKSNNVMAFVSYDIFTSRKITMYGKEIYEFKGNLKIRILKSCWRLTDGLGNVDGLFESREEKPETESNGWEIGKAEFYEAGTIRSLNNLPVTFEKFDQGWKMRDVDYQY